MTQTGPVRGWDTFWANLKPGIGSEFRGRIELRLLEHLGIAFEEDSI